jgi:hypothetical protein
MSQQNSDPSLEPSSGSGVGEKPLNFAKVQAEEEAALGESALGRSALCISGGGIRSATFALGALQALADLDILQNFDYVSTVSGGGYIGSWLSAWKKRQGSLQKIIPGLKTPSAFSPPSVPDPVQHLREYNNYLSPKLGFFSADTWMLIATVTRNMLLNWLVLIPLLMFFLMLPRLVLALARLGETLEQYYGKTAGYAHARIEDAIPICGGLLFAVAVYNTFRYLPGMGGKEHTEKDFLTYCFLPLVGSALAVIMMDSWFTGGDQTRGYFDPATLKFWSLWLWVAGSGAVGWLSYLIFHFNKVMQKPQILFGMTLALMLTSFSVSGGAWLLMDKLYLVLSWPLYVTIAAPLLLLVFGLAATLFVGLSSIHLTDEDREWLSRAAGWVLLSVVVWSSFCALVLLAPSADFEIFKSGQGHNPHLPNWLRATIAVLGALSGLMSAFGGKSSKTDAGQGQQSNQSQDQKSGLVSLAMKIAPPLFIAVVMVLLAKLTDWILGVSRLVTGDWRNHKQIIEDTHFEAGLLLALVFLALAWIMARYVNVNKFSLHSMYRERLVRAYLGASNPNSKAKTFTGFSNDDNVRMTELLPSGKPFHVVNICLNLVSGKRLAWQQRKAESFTISPLHCGSYSLGYRPTGLYGGKGGVSLGTAIAISGAAASPNMGYHSSPAIGFIMTLFNARLGAWFGNPSRHTWTHEGPRSALNSIIREACGLTDDTSPYVYLSDGGHFENLALYEMIMRRCRYIVVLDGGADPQYSYQDLGNALRKIRIDMQASIKFEEPFLAPLAKPQYRCAIATIGYPDNKESYVIYLKPVVLGNEPPDVTTYKAAHDDFPHQSTANQFFDESQTESYRMLGSCSIKDIFQLWDAKTGFQGLVDSARNHLRPSLSKQVAAGGGK